MNRKTILSLFLGLSLCFSLVACGGGGGGGSSDSGNGGGSGGNVVFAENDLIGTWRGVDMDLVIDGTRSSFGVLVVTSPQDPDYYATITMTEQGQINLIYTAVDDSYNVTQGTWTGTMNSAKNGMTFTRDVWSSSDGTSGDNAISIVFNKI